MGLEMINRLEDEHRLEQWGIFARCLDCPFRSTQKAIAGITPLTGRKALKLR